MKYEEIKQLFVKTIQLNLKGHHFNIDSFQIIKCFFFRKMLDKLEFNHNNGRVFFITFLIKAMLNLKKMGKGKITKKDFQQPINL